MRPETGNTDCLPVEDQRFPQGDSVCLCQKSIKRLNHILKSQFSMAQRLRRNHDFLKCTPTQHKAILKEADDALVKTICECIFNVLKETVPVSKPGKRKLLAHKKSLIALAEKSPPLNKKKKILVQQGGNFLSVLLPPVLRVLSSILA